MTTKDSIIALIQELAPNHDLPWELVAAIVQIESSFDTYAMRYEPGYRWIAKEDLSATERTARMTSWGLMQVMGAVAREHNMTGYLSRLTIPAVGLYYGMVHLAKFRRRWPQDWKDVIASYNAGSPRRTAEGKYLNQAYVDKVLAAWQSYESSVPLKETEV